MLRPRTFGCAGAALALSIAARGAPAQVTAQGRQSLNFGVTLPGVNRSVAPSATTSAGQFYVLEHLGGVVRLSFTLPTKLSRSGGGTLTISFATTDALYRLTSSGATSVVFNPATAKNVTLSTSADMYVQLGGTVKPTAAQATGTYTGTVTLTITVIS